MTGPKGTFRQTIPPGVRFELNDSELTAHPVRENEPSLGKFHGLARSLVANAVHGVSEGFRKELDIVGIGYRAEVSGTQVVFALGYSHPVVFDIPAGIDIAIVGISGNPTRPSRSTKSLLHRDLQAVAQLQ